MAVTQGPWARAAPAAAGGRGPRRESPPGLATEGRFCPASCCWSWSREMHAEIIIPARRLQAPQMSSGIPGSTRCCPYITSYKAQTGLCEGTNFYHFDFLFAYSGAKTSLFMNPWEITSMRKEEKMKEKKLKKLQIPYYNQIYLD